MVEVKFYDNVADEFLKFAVIISKTDNKWVFCKHKERETYEIPGGHREPGESVLETANELKNFPHSRSVNVEDCGEYIAGFGFQCYRLTSFLSVRPSR